MTTPHNQQPPSQTDRLAAHSPTPIQPSIPPQALGKGRQSMSKEMKVALIGFAGTILAALVGGLFTLYSTSINQSPPTPVPTSVPTSTSSMSIANTPCQIKNMDALAPTIPSVPTDQQRDTILNTYEGNINYLVLNCGLRSSKPGDQLRVIAQTETISTIMHLDTTRNIQLLQFLRTSHLIGSGQNIISFANADLSGADLRDVDLSGADLNHAKLINVNLNRAIMRDADLSYADLSWANIGNVDFSGANLKGATRQDTGGFTRDGEIVQGAIMPDGSKHP